MVKNIVLVLLVLVPTSAAAESRFTGVVWEASMVTAITAHGADLGATENCLGRGICRETNILLMHFSDKPVLFSVTKMGGAALTIWLTSKAPKPVGIAINVATTIAMSVVTYRNGVKVAGAPH